MSYCRFSSMNWGCDVYVYKHVYGGYVTYIASRKLLFLPIPDIICLTRKFLNLIGVKCDYDFENRRIVYPSKLHELIGITLFKFSAFWHNKVHMVSVELIPRRVIKLPYAGETFSDETPGECAERLRDLKRTGYTVPQYAIDALVKEQVGLDREAA